MQALFKHPWLIRNAINLWPPFRGAGIRIDALSADYMHCTVSLKFRWWNKNANRSQYGGSMFSMTDPIYPLMLMGILGNDYVVWDKAASIDYVAPGTKQLFAEFVLSQQQVDDIIAATAGGEKVLPEFKVIIRDSGGRCVAKIRRTLYLRKKVPVQASVIVENVTA